MRMPDHRMQKKLLAAWIDSPRRPGRPAKTYYESMRDAMEECGIALEGFGLLARNEPMWEVLTRRTVAQRAVVAEKFACGTRGRDALTTNELLLREYNAGVFGPPKTQLKKKKIPARVGRVDVRTLNASMSRLSPSPPPWCSPKAIKNLVPRPEEFPTLLLNAASPSWTPPPPPTLQNQLFEMAKVAFENPAT